MKALAALCEMGEVAAGLDGLDILAQHVLESAVTLTDADYALLLLRDENSGHLTLSAGLNLPISIAESPGKSICGRVGRSGDHNARNPGRGCGYDAPV